MLLLSWTGGRRDGRKPVEVEGNIGGKECSGLYDCDGAG